MNKNNVLFLLFVAALLGSTWGAVVNRQKIDLEQQLRDARAELQKCDEKSGQGLARVPGKAADTRSLLEKEEQLAMARKELAEWQKKTQALETKLSESTAAIQDLSREKEGLVQRLTSGRAEVAGQEETSGAAQRSGGEGAARQEDGAGDVQLSGLTREGMQKRLDEVSAQLLGLEKIVDEKNTALSEAAREKERLQINMDVLLAKIADQQRELLAIQEENRELVKQLAARNEMVDLHEKEPAAGK